MDLLQKEEMTFKAEGHTWPESKRHETDFNYDDKMDMLEHFKSGELGKGEVPSVTMATNARSLAKLASGISMNDGHWMDHSTWDAFHSDPKPSQETWLLDMVTNYTQSGIHVYDIKMAEQKRKELGQELTLFDRKLHEQRKGFYGW